MCGPPENPGGPMKATPSAYAPGRRMSSRAQGNGGQAPGAAPVRAASRGEWLDTSARFG